MVIEFYVLPMLRGAAVPLFREFVAASRATRFEVQTNDQLLTLMIFDFAANIERNEVLFRDEITTTLSLPSMTFRRVAEVDRERIVSQKLDADAGWLIEENGVVVATGGILFHYNIPYGDIYMAVAEPHRRRGIGSYLVQELKRACYEMGRIPAARCNATNAASRLTLEKSGMLPCARLLTGEIVV
jgi:GNAT superfamily N-acetyltransferase